MKNIFLKLCRWVLPILGIGSVTSCVFVDPRVEYGVPYSSFEVKCKVVDSETKTNVKGIMLTPGEMNTYIDEHGKEIKVFVKLADGVQSDTGIFELKGEMFGGCCEAPVLHVELRDLDVEQDGNYKDSTYVVPLKKVKEGGKNSNWYVGAYAADVTLEAKQVK